jgi:glycine/D-amino acid oxidase-like deaminating enzyme
MSPDENFLVDRHPGHDSICFVAGLSGHVKFTSVLGEVLADMTLSGRSSLPIGFLVARFSFARKRPARASLDTFWPH